LFQQGRGGLSIGATSTGMGATTPELQALANARAQQDAILAANAQQEGQRSVAFGSGLLGQGLKLGMEGQGFGVDLLRRQQEQEQQRMQFGTGLFGAGSGLFGQYNTNVTGALQPYSAYADLVRRLEEQGMGPLEMSAALGGRAMQGGAYAGKYGLEGATAAGTAQQKADAFSPGGTFVSGLGGPEFKSGLGNLFGGGGRSMFSQTGLGQSGFGTGLAYGNQDYSLFI